MLTQREIISTLEMLRNENLDVRTVTLGINLLDCAGPDLNGVRRRIAERVMRLSGQLVPVCDRVGQKYGIPVVNKRIAVSPIAASSWPTSRIAVSISDAGGSVAPSSTRLGRLGSI